MEFSKKFVLVPEERVEVMEQISELDQRMKNILHNEDLTEEEKTILYLRVLQKYTHFSNENRKESESVPNETSLSENQETESLKENLKESVVKTEKEVFEDEIFRIVPARCCQGVRHRSQRCFTAVKSFKTTGMCSRRHGGGRVRSTTPAEDRYIVLSAKRNRRTTAQQHRTACLQWCREHHNWTEQDWACVLFSDESKFSLSSDCRRQLIWRESGTAYRPENIQEKDRYPTCSIMVWAGIMINGRTRLHVVANGTMTGQRYIDEVLLPHVRLFRGAVGDKFVFMDDNATYLNPIENVWDALGRQVAGRNYPPTNKNTLIRALTEEWDKLPQQLLDNVVQTICDPSLAIVRQCTSDGMEDDIVWKNDDACTHSEVSYISVCHSKTFLSLSFSRFPNRKEVTGLQANERGGLGTGFQEGTKGKQKGTPQSESRHTTFFHSCVHIPISLS
ncbi:transposable element Tcb2 transposase [Trichonephila clavipes]|nr:transposable element Tcb2 transposase [Trichonephila clavipes]